MGLSVVCDDCYEVVDSHEMESFELLSCPHCHNGKYMYGDI